jgi:hypothetical protein
MPAPKVLDLGDRKLRYEQALVDAFIDAIEQSQAQTVLVPSLSEPHPDHQACALAALDAGLRLQARCGSLKRILFYEDGAPMHPNALVVIDEVADLKWFAIEAFGSQLSLESYAPMAKALASLRAFGAGLKGLCYSGSTSCPSPVALGTLIIALSQSARITAYALRVDAKHESALFARGHRQCLCTKLPANHGDSC